MVRAEEESPTGECRARDRCGRSKRPVRGGRGPNMIRSAIMEPRRTRITGTRKTRLGPESDRADREYWAAFKPEERVLETWRLSLELWEFKGWDTGEPGLHRAVARIARH